MNTTGIKAVYFSPGGTTRRLVTHLADTLASLLGAGVAYVDFTLPAARRQSFRADCGELVVVALPVYAGRLPNLLLKYLDTWEGNGALAVPVVMYGNRSYGNALLELHDLLQGKGFRPLAAAAFVGQHSFARCLAAGRPDAADLALAGRFARTVAFRMQAGELPWLALPGLGAPDYGGYYQPLGEDGAPVRFLKAKPLTSDACTACGRCAAVCPMGAIDPLSPADVPGTCIKCNACITVCPTGAKRLTDPAYLSHLRFLEAHYTVPAPVELF